MTKSIAILGSTGSIGKTLLKILDENKKSFKVILLTSNTSHKSLLNQAKKFNVKNLIITDKMKYLILKEKTKNTNINVYNNFDNFKKIFNKKVDYTMSSITGIAGLEPTIKMIKFSKMIAIANKESIICGWNLINSELKKYKTKFIPVDSEHFSIWYGLQNSKIENVEKVFLTASGGPFYNRSHNNFRNIKVSEALKHPNWKMGKKISTDSATLINKIYEVIETRNIFNIDYKKIKIIIHPKSYVHAILKFNNGLTKIIIHDTDMKVPIFNTLYLNKNIKLKSNKININLLNNLDFRNVNPKTFPMTKLLKLLPLRYSLYETVIVAANDKLVELFLENKINFIDIQKRLFKIIKNPEFLAYKQKQPKKLSDIVKLNDYVRIKIAEKSI